MSIVYLSPLCHVYIGSVLSIVYLSPCCHRYIGSVMSIVYLSPLCHVYIGSVLSIVYLSPCCHRYIGSVVSIAYLSPLCKVYSLRGFCQVSIFLCYITGTHWKCNVYCLLFSIMSRIHFVSVFPIVYLSL